jgi:hypothetical protein
MIEQTLDIATKDGAMETFICRPERSPHPAVVFLIDAPGIRDGLRDMDRDPVPHRTHALVLRAAVLEHLRPAHGISSGAVIICERRGGAIHRAYATLGGAGGGVRIADSTQSGCRRRWSSSS